MRRPSTVELMLLTTVLLWALNLSVTKYILTHGFAPLPYATVRYGLAALIFVGADAVVERTLRVERRHVPILALAAVLLCVNQLCFVFALDVTTASTIGLVLGAIPIFAALFGLAPRNRAADPAFLACGSVSALGVGLVAVGSGGELSSGLGGILLGLATAATWAAYSVTVGTADALVLAVADECDRDPRRVGRARARRASADGRPGLGARLGDLGAPGLRDHRPARRDERALVSVGSQDRREPGVARGEPRSRSWPRCLR